MITRAIFEGCYILADKVKETFRGKTAECIYCGAKMTIKKRPLKESFYFALCKGEKHTGVCKYYEGEKDIPTLKDISPEELLSNICKPTQRRSKDINNPSITNNNGNNASTTTKKTIKETILDKIRSVLKMIKSGIYFEKPLEKVDPDSKYRYIDFCVTDKSAKYLWKNQKPVELGLRVIDGRWIGSMNFDSPTIQRIEHVMEETKMIWLKMFWINDEGKYETVMFCLDCTSCFSAVKEKLFSPRSRANGTWWEYAPKGCDILEIFVCAHWELMDANVCRNNCPTCSDKFCSECKHRVYYGKINTNKQLESFPEDGIYKRRHK